MRQGYEAVIFDLDGTLLDTTEGVVAAVKYTIESAGLPMLSEAELLKFIGPPIQESLKAAYGLSQDKAKELTNIFRNQYKDKDLLKATPYEGIFQVFEELKQRNILIGVATYKREDYAKEILKHFGFDGYSEYLYGADFENRLSKADIIKKCLADMKLSDYSRVVMVGDTSFDARGAKEIGTDFIGVTYGFEFRNKEEVYEGGAVGWAKMPKDILKYI